MITFERRKEDCLKKDDKSSIGSWDKPIAKLCEKINQKNNYYTLSSCSGRVVLIKNLDKKQPGMFVLRTHDKITFKGLKKVLKEIEAEQVDLSNKKEDGNKLASKKKLDSLGEDLIFKQESVILHVCCKTLDDAEEMLEKARICGWKNSGIMSTKGRIVLELRSTEYLALPIIKKGKILVSDDFLKILVKESNIRLEKTWQKIGKLEKLI